MDITTNQNADFRTYLSVIEKFKDLKERQEQYQSMQAIVSGQIKETLKIELKNVFKKMNNKYKSGEDKLSVDDLTTVITKDQ